jgi:hypothetical protein
MQLLNYAAAAANRLADLRITRTMLLLLLPAAACCRLADLRIHADGLLLPPLISKGNDAWLTLPG